MSEAAAIHPAARDAASARGFLGGFAAAAAAALALWIGAVLAFDPFLAFGTRMLPASVIKPTSRMLGDEQLIKDHLFLRRRPETAIIGSSRSAYGIDPGRGALASEKAYNLAMLGATLTELEGLAGFARANRSHVRRLVVGIDHYMFFRPDTLPADAAQVRIRRMEEGHGPLPIPLRHPQTFLMSTKLASTMEDILSNWRRRDNLGEADGNGFMHGTYRFRIADRSRTFEITLRDLLGQGWYAAPDEARIAQRLRRVAGMIRQTCQAGIRVDALFSPEHAMLHEAAVNAGQQARREQLRRDMARLMGLLATEMPDCLRYRDASGLSDAAVEPLRLPAGAEPQFIEVSHYAAPVGERLMLSFANPDHPSALGLDTAVPGLLDRDILATRLKLDEWRARNPDDAAFVKRLQDAAKAGR
jgi:hypothetical protein